MGAAALRPGFHECLSTCKHVDTSEWVPYAQEGEKRRQPASDFTASSAVGGRHRRRRLKGAREGLELDCEVAAKRLEELTFDLFKVHDLNGNGLLEEQELVSLNERIALLHHGQDADTREVRAKYKDLFRTKLDPDGKPVPYATFRAYALEVLQALDSDVEAQELILEQFVAEATSACQALPCSLAGDTDHFSARHAREEPALVELECPLLPGSVDPYHLDSGTVMPGPDGL